MLELAEKFSLDEMFSKTFGLKKMFINMTSSMSMNASLNEELN
jgi:hypothetical protein